MSSSNRRDDSTNALSRRSFLRGATAGVGVAGLGTTASTAAAAQSDPDYGGWFDGVDNYDGTTVDKTGQDQVTVTVGAQGNGGTFAFAPPAVRVSPGTTVEFIWESNTHNVVVESQPGGADWSGHETIEDTGFSFTHTFETEGIYTYFCQPHETMGMKGAVVVSQSPESGGSDGGGAAKQAGERPGGQPEGYVSVWEALFAGSILVAMLAPIVSNVVRRQRGDTPGQ